MAAAAAITPAQSSTTTIFTSLTTMCTPDDVLERATLDIVHQPRDTHAPDTLPNRCLIRAPSHHTTVVAELPVRTTAQFRQRGRTIRRLQGLMRLTIQTWPSRI